MFNHEGELYLVARTDPTGPFMSNYTATSELPPNQHHLYDLVAYSLRAHGTAIWRLNRETAALEWLLDLPGCGDTAFPRLVITYYLALMVKIASQNIFVLALKEPLSLIN